MSRLPSALSTVVAPTLAASISLGCAAAPRESQRPELSASVAEAAESLAGFDLSCEPEELSVQAFHERRSFDTQVVLVGAAGCGRRSYYEVRCAGPNCWARPLTSIRKLDSAH